MLRSRSFAKKTRKGGIVKVVREHYLRDDVMCGSMACKTCDYEDDADKFLEDNLVSISTTVPESHYLLPDTNVVLHQIDMLEQEAMKNIIICQTVLGEVKNRNNATYNRIRKVISDNEKHFYAFTNEHHRETYIERIPDESSNDYNDRAIRVAASWYNRHLEGTNIKVILLTNDAECLRKAREEKIPSFTLEEYVQGVKDQPALLDLVSLGGQEVEATENINYPEYVAQSKMMAGIKAGKYHQGTFNRSRENYLEGLVQVPGYEQPVLLKGRLACNRCIEGDMVAVDILPQDQWEYPSKRLVDEEKAEETVDDEEKEKDPSETPTPVQSKVPPPPNGRVIGVIRHNWRSYCGVLLPTKNASSYSRLFRAAERSIPYIRIRTRQGEALNGQQLIVRIDGWERRSRYPHGHYVKTIGRMGEKETENEVLLIEHDVPFHSFSNAVLNCLPAMPWGLTDDDIKRRKDLRGLNVCSIDPPGCTDIDDALHVRMLPNGNIEAGVHIADVTHFVKPNTPLDEEASSRGTTVYLTDKRIDMLPELLGTNLCSLRSDVDRLAFSVLWELDQEGNMVDVMFTKSIIRSKASLTYEEAQSRIDDPTMKDELTEGIRELNRLAKIFRQRRMDAGALTLSSPEVRFQLADDEQHDPLDVQVKELKETNHLVEEFMLFANCTVATKIYSAFPDSALLRRHPPPPQAKFDELLRWTKSVGVELSTESSKALADSLDKAVKEDHPFFNELIRILTTRCMMQAVYFSSGLMPQDEFLHYGLAAPIYTHFTSPIRRYSDDIVHRMLAACIGWEDAHPSLLDKNKMGEICDNLNYRHRMAQFAGRASVELYTHLYFKNKVVDEDAYVIRVRDNALIVLVPKYGIEGTIFLEDKVGSGTSALSYNDDEQSLTITLPGDEGKTTVFKMFEKVTVQISINTKDLQHQKLQMQLVNPVVPGVSVNPAPPTLQEVEDKVVKSPQQKPEQTGEKQNGTKPGETEDVSAKKREPTPKKRKTAK